MEIAKVSSSGMEILNRLRKGEICNEELKKLIGLQWEKRQQWGYKPTQQQQLQFNLDFIKFSITLSYKLGAALKEMEMSGEIEAFNNETYELPTKLMEFFHGKTLKQSAVYFKDESILTLDEAEEAMYELYCERAQIKDGQSVVDIGCGYGGLVLYIAQKYKNCHVTGITNATTQADYIKMQRKKLQLSNVDVILADVTKYDNGIKTFDRIMLIGVIEHMKNIELFMKKMSTWMKKDSLMFVDHQCHKSFNFHFEAIDEDDWYSGFVYPKGCLMILWSSCLLYFQDDVSVMDHWVLSGMHTVRTGLEWLKKLEHNMDSVRGILLEQQKQNPPAASMAKEGAGNEDIELQIQVEAEAAVNKVVTHLKTLCICSSVTSSSNNGEELMNAQFLFKKK